MLALRRILAIPGILRLQSVWSARLTIGWCRGVRSTILALRWARIRLLALTEVSRRPLVMSTKRLVLERLRRLRLSGRLILAGRWPVRVRAVLPRRLVRCWRCLS